MKSKAPNKPYWEMNLAELREATKEFDHPQANDGFGPPPPAARARLRCAKRKRGRPRVGRGATRVMVSFEGGLLKRIDAAAKARGITRSQFLAEHAESGLARAR
jgi:hypothetical protein